MNLAHLESSAIGKAIYLTADIFLYQFLIYLKKEFAKVSHDEALRRGRRYGALVHALSVMLFALFFKEEQTQRMVKKAFGNGMKNRQARRIAKKSWENFGMMIAETLATMDWPRRNIGELFEIEGIEHAIGAYRGDRGLIFSTAHFGSWELFGNVPKTFYQKEIAAVIREQPLPRVNRFLEKMRSVKIRFLYPKNTKTFWKTRSFLKEGGIVAIIMDHYFDGMKVLEVPFFGKPAKTPRGPAMLARITNTPMVPLFIYREPDNPARHRIRIDPAIRPDRDLDPEQDETRILSYYRACLEERIRQDPAQYLWTFDSWRQG